jgi:hypothetical protein
VWRRGFRWTFSPFRAAQLEWTRWPL